MKNLLFLVLLTFGLFACEKDSVINEDQKNDSQTELSFAAGWPTIIFGTRSKPCGSSSECYCEGDRGICLIIEPRVASPTQVENHVFEVNEGAATLSILNSTEMLIEMQVDNSSVSASQSIFKVRDDLLLDSVFNFPVTILEGDYTIDYSSNSLGNIIVDIQ